MCVLPADMLDAESTLTVMGFCSGVHTKEMYLPKEVLDGEHDHLGL